MGDLFNERGQLVMSELDALSDALAGQYRSTVGGQVEMYGTSAGQFTVGGNQLQYKHFKITRQPTSAKTAGTAATLANSYRFEEWTEFDGDYVKVAGGLTHDAIYLFEINSTITVPVGAIVRAWLSDDGSFYWFDARGEHTYFTLDVVTGACPILADITLDDITPTGSLVGVTIRGRTLSS